MDIETGEQTKSPQNYKKVNPPFGYFGSKNKLAFQLVKELPPHNCWVEAFCGSAALTFAKSPASIEIINDIDGEIINVFAQLRDNHEDLCRLVELTPYARQELMNARKPNGDDTDLERARKFLVQSMMAVNGIFGKERGGFSITNSYSRSGREARVNRWINLPKRLENVVCRLKNVRIENQDGINLLKKFVRRPATLVYIDPPYLGDRSDGYNIDANDIEYHKELLSVANQAECMIFFSSYENDLYEATLTAENGWQKRMINASTKNSRGSIYNRTEIVWMNQHFVNAQEKNEIPVQLTEKELKQNKVNPER